MAGAGYAITQRRAEGPRRGEWESNACNYIITYDMASSVERIWCPVGFKNAL